MSKPITATEIKFQIRDAARKELLNWLMSGGLDDHELVINISHFDGGELGSVICEVKRWNPPTSTDQVS